MNVAFSEKVNFNSWGGFQNSPCEEGNHWAQALSQKWEELRQFFANLDSATVKSAEEYTWSQIEYGGKICKIAKNTLKSLSAILPFASIVNMLISWLDSSNIVVATPKIPFVIENLVEFLTTCSKEKFKDFGAFLVSVSALLIEFLATITEAAEQFAKFGLLPDFIFEISGYIWDFVLFLSVVCFVADVRECFDISEDLTYMRNQIIDKVKKGNNQNLSTAMTNFIYFKNSYEQYLPKVSELEEIAKQQERKYTPLESGKHLEIQRIERLFHEVQRNQNDKTSQKELEKRLDALAARIQGAYNKQKSSTLFTGAKVAANTFLVVSAVVPILAPAMPFAYATKAVIDGYRLCCPVKNEFSAEKYFQAVYG